MRKLCFKSIFLFFLLSSSSCVGHSGSLTATAESLYNHPLPYPKFILDLSSFDKAQRIIISQEPFARPDYYADELYQHLSGNVSFTLDGIPIPQENVDRAVAPMAYPIYKGREIVGFYGGPITLWVNIGGQKAGWHVMTIKIIDLLGDEVSYQWALRIE